MIVDGDDCTFRLLGPVQVTVAGRLVTFPRRQQLDLLAFMLLHADHVVTVPEIVDAMWGDAVPRTASTQIRNMLSALRGGLTDGARTLATVDRHPAGYRLRVPAGQLDLAVFTALVAEARETPTPADVTRLLRRALGLWRGTQALAGVRAAFVEGVRTHLAEQRTAVREALFDAELEGGNHAKIVAELTDAVADNPGRERFVGQLMIALYRSGRATDSLAVYRRARQTLAEEYGLEPGPALRELERLVLLSDPTLGGPVNRRTDAAADEQPPAVPRGPAPRYRDAPTGSAGIRPARPSTLPVPAQLPLDVRGFTGRTAELARLTALIADPREPATTMVICALMGTPGVGKTALAVHWAHQVAERFPDGQLYVNLRGFDPDGPATSPEEAVRGFLDAFGVPPERIPTGVQAQAALYRSLVAGRRVLVVLDNAVHAGQIRPLLPGTPGCLVLVTSRNQLTGLVVVEGAYPLTLQVLTPTEAREMLVGRLGQERVAGEPQAVEAISRHCARLPLALAMVAARAAIHPTFPLTALSAELSAARDGLDPLAGDESTDGVHTVFSWSYHRLSPAAARLFRLLGLHPGPDLAVTAAASLAGCPLAGVRPLLAELTRAHLVAEHGPGRYALHDLLRAYAADLARTADPDEERHSAVRRMFDHYLHTAYAAALLIYPHRYQLSLLPARPGVSQAELPGRDEALDWFTVEHPVLVGVIDRAAEAGLGTHTWQLASTLATFLDRRGHWHDWAATQRTAVGVAQRLGDRVGQAHAHGSLGLACTRLRWYGQAHTHLHRAFTLLVELDDRIGQAYTHLRMCAVYEGQGDLVQALHQAGEARKLYRDAGHRAGYAQALNTLGWYHARLGQHRDAIGFCEQALALHQELGDRQGVAHTLDSLGYAHHHLGQHHTAAAYYRQSLEILREAGDTYYEAVALTHLGDTQHAAGNADGAREAWQHALDILDQLGHPDAEHVRDLVDPPVPAAAEHRSPVPYP
jgi:DNA-binding SARP family transcriptional activator/tetratricopeptide (TPR) repeat protein